MRVDIAEGWIRNIILLCQ